MLARYVTGETQETRSNEGHSRDSGPFRGLRLRGGAYNEDALTIDPPDYPHPREQRVGAVV